MPTTTFDQHLAEVLARIRSSGTGLESWVDPLLSLETTTPEEEEEKEGLLSTLGGWLHEPKRRVDIALNYYAGGPLRDAVMAGEEPVPSGELAKDAYLAPPDPSMSQTEQHARAAGRGLLERWINVSTDPALYAIPLVMRGVPALIGSRAVAAAIRAGATKAAAAQAGKAATASAHMKIGIPAGVGFAGMMAKGTVEQADRTYQTYKAEGWSPSTSEEAAKTAFDVGLLGTMAAGFIPRRAKGGAVDAGGEIARREPIPTRPVPHAPPGPFKKWGRRWWSKWVPFDVYETYQAEYLRRQRLGLPPPEPPPGVPPGPPPTHPDAPVGPARPRIREVNVPDTPERMADAALLGQIKRIRDAMDAALDQGEIDRAMELRTHHERLTDVYRTRRFAPDVRVGREGDMMQLKAQLDLELSEGASMTRQMEIAEVLAVLDAEIGLARSARTGLPQATGEAPAAPGEPSAAPAPAGPGAPPAPPGPISSRSPQVTPGERGPVGVPRSPEEVAKAASGDAAQGVQELVEGAQSMVSGMPPPASSPMATVLEGGELAGQGRRAGAQGPLTPTAVLPPAPAAPGRPGVTPPPILPGYPGGPALDVQLGPEGPPRLGPPPRFVAGVSPAGEEAPAAPEPPPLPEPAPEPEPAPPPTPAAPPSSDRRMQPLEELSEPTKGLRAKSAAEKAKKGLPSYVTIGGKKFWSNGQLMVPTTKIPEGVTVTDMSDPVLALVRDSVRTEPLGFEKGQKGSVGAVWFEGKTYNKQGKASKPFFAALDPDYYRTLNQMAGKNEGSRWQIAPPKKGKVPPAIILMDQMGTKILGLAAPLNEVGPPPKLVKPPTPQVPAPAKYVLPSFVTAGIKPDVPAGMRAAAAELEAELTEEPPPTPAPTPTIGAGRGATLDDIIAWAEGPDAQDQGFRAPDLADRLESIALAVEENPEGSKWPAADIWKAQERVRERTAVEAEPAPVEPPVKKAKIIPTRAEGGGVVYVAEPIVEPPDQIAELETEQAALKTQRTEQLATENARLQAELEETDAKQERGARPASEEILPRAGLEAEGGGEVRGAPPEPAGEVDGGVYAGGREGTGLRPSGGAGEGRDVPATGAVSGAEPSLTTATPAGVPIPEVRADGETRTVEPAKPPTKAPRKEVRTFKWSDGELEKTEQRSVKAKSKDNLKAIGLLKEIEAADRVPTAEEQSTLAAYVGWGGMPRVFKDFDYGKDSDFWEERHKELVEALTPEEYETAKASVTNAHYTREAVIREMWKPLAAWGGGRMMRALEPSMGVGNFISAMPDEFRPAHFTGIELDPITGRIAKRLFPQANIHVAAFESTPVPDNYFDVAISNVPFGPFGVSDPRFRDQSFLTQRIHNYFFAKALDKVRPGGVLAFITSHGTLDAKDSAFRDYMAEKSYLIGAVRLPRTTFERNANTGVTTDVIFMQKKIPGRERPAYAADDSWTETVTREEKGDYGNIVEARLSRYFEDNPTNVLGELAIGDGTAGPNELTVKGDFDARSMAVALGQLGAPGLLERPVAAAPPPPVATHEEIRRMKPGSYAVREGKVWEYREDGTFKPADFKGKGVKTAKDWVPLRDAAREVIATQLERGTDAELRAAQKKLNKTYDTYLRRHGPLHVLSTTAKALRLDPDFPLTLALEEWTPPQRKGRKLVKAGSAKKRGIFTKRTVTGYDRPKTSDSPAAAYGVALAETGRTDVDRIAGLLSTSPSEALGQLLGEGLAYEDPSAGNNLETAEQYLSGNVVQKLEQATAAVETEATRYGRNVTALEAVQPEPLRPDEISVQLGAPWVPTDVYEKFAAVVLGGASEKYWSPGEPVRIRHSEALGLYKITWDYSVNNSAAATSTYGSSAMNALELFDKGMNLRTVVVRTGSGDDRHVDPEATALAQDKLEQIKERFGTWVWEDPTRSEQLLEIYNREFNNQRLRTPDGSHLKFPGMNRSVLRGGDLAPHQKNDVWRILTQPNTLIAEPVGSGKTWTLVAALMEARRTGQVRKPVLAVPNAVFEQWSADWSALYPQAKLLIVQPKELTGKDRAETMSRIATEEWDGVLITHEALKSLPVSAKALEAVVREEVSLLDQTIRELASDLGEGQDIGDFITSATKKGRREYGEARVSKADTRLVKDIEKQKAALNAKLKKMYENAKRDKTIAFDELGVDMLLVDEAHSFNNLYFPTKLGRVKGISNENADRAFDLYIKIKTLQAQQNGRGVVFATATPVRNTLAEIYTLFRYLNPAFLKERGLRHFDDWVRAFAEPRQTLALKPTGSGYRSETRFSAFVNVPELLTAFRNFTAVLTQEDLKLPVPEVALNSKGERRANFIEVEPTDDLRGYVEELNARSDAVKNRLVEPEDDNSLLISTDGRKAALDLTMVGRATEPVAGQKLDIVRQKVYDIWKDTTSTRGVQAIFLDLSTPDAQPFSAYRWLKDAWVGMGVPAEEVDFIHNYDRKSRTILLEKLNKSEVRIVIGSSKKLGVGANFQKNLVALHHVDVPYTPDAIEQRNGRGIRQGNMNPEVQIHSYVTKGTYDAYMWQLISGKAGFIGQIMTGKATARTMEDVSLTYLTAQEALAATSENPLVVKKIMLEADLRKYERLLGAHNLETYENASRVAKWKNEVQFHKDRARVILQAASEIKPGHTLELYAAPGQKPMAKAVDTFEKRTDEAGEKLKGLIEGIEPGHGEYYIGRYRGFPIRVARRGGAILGKDVVLTTVILPSPSSVAELTPDELGTETAWRAMYQGTGTGLLQSMDTRAPTAEEAKSHTNKATGRETEIAKLVVPEFRYTEKLDEAKKDLEKINKELATDENDAGAVATDEAGGDDGGDFAEDADYEAGETGVASPENVAPDEVPPAAGGAGKKPPPGNSTPDGLPSDGPQPGEDGWQRRVDEAKARNRKRGRGGQMNAGVDPMHMADMAVEGADLVNRGVRRFGAWSRAMMNALGSIVPGLRTMLRGLWNWIRQMFRSSGRGPNPGETRRTRARPGFEEYRTEYEKATAGQKGAGRRRYPWEEREIPPEEVRQAAEEGARVGEEPPPKYGKPPKGDINFDRIGGEPDIREWQARVIESLKPRWGKIRNYRSWGEAREAAVKAGLTEKDFIRLVKERGVVTDIELEAGRMMRQEAGEQSFAKLNRLKELQEQRRKATDELTKRRLDEEILEADREYRDALARFSATTAATVEAAAELGRALNMHKKMAQAISPEESFFRQLLRKHPGMNDKMQNELADAVMRKDASRLRELSRKLYKPGPLDYVTEWFVNSLLSGLTTLEVNVQGNLVWEALVRTPERLISAGLEKIGARQWVERVFGRDALPRERFGREFEEALRTHTKNNFGMVRALKYAWQYLSTEPANLHVRGEYRPKAFQGALGVVIRTPSRMMYALDLGSRWAAMEAELSVQTVRRAITEARKAGGWTRAQVNTRMREFQEGFRRYTDLEARRQGGDVLSREDYQFLQRNPVYGRWKAKIRQAGAEATWTDSVDRFTAGLMQMREAHPWMTLFLPFIKTPSRILASALNRSPYAAYDVFRKAKGGELRGGELSDAMARVVYGNIIGASLYMMARQGLISGSGPTDPRERAIKRKTGWVPYGAKIGDTWVSMARLEPLATHLGWAADLAEAKDARGAAEIYDKLIQSISLNIVNKTYLQGPIGLAEALGDPERYGAHLGRKTLGAFVPNLLAQAARAIDPNVRETDTVAGTLLSRIPILSKSLPPRRTGMGELMTREEHPLSRWISPYRYSTVKGPEANLERIFLDVGYIPSNAPKTLTVPGTGGRKVALTGEERQLYGDFKARATRFARGMAQNENFLALQPWQQEELLKRIYRFAHDAAHKAMVASVMQRSGSVEWVK